MSTTARAKGALRRNFIGTPNHKGYTRWPQENLLPGIRLEMFEEELRAGDGNELQVKFCAVHSSAVLAVNCFAPFKDYPENLIILGKHAVKPPEFEYKLEIFPHKTGPNIDVWIDCGNEIIAVESKLLEYLEPKRPSFSGTYEQLASKSESCWWRLYEEMKQKPEIHHLERAQLVKHYFGLNKFRVDHPEGPKLTLLYLFWEPLNSKEIGECRKHEEELVEFAGAVSDSEVGFSWKNYTDLWGEWLDIPILKEHARRLIERYQVTI